MATVKLSGTELAKVIDGLVYQLNLPKAEFYENAGISAANVSQWRNGKYEPSDKKIAQIQEASGLNDEQFVKLVGLILDDKSVLGVAIPTPKGKDFSHLIAFKTADMTADQIEAIKNLIITMGGEIV